VAFDFYREGQVLRGRYEIVRMIKSSGLSHVYLAEDRELDKRVVIKRPAYSNNPWSNRIKVERLQIEAKVLSALNHPCIIRYVDSWNYDSEFHIVTEYVAAKSMKEKFANMPPPVNEAVEYVLELLETLEYVHRKGVIHRDVKPSNVLMADNVVLIDFGACIADFLGSKYQSVKMGTPGYQCPELFEGRVTPQCDIYSVGATISFLLSGKKPSLHSSVPNPSMETDLEQVIRRAMSKRLSERFTTAFEMEEALEKVAKKTREPTIIVGNKRYEIDRDKMIIGRGGEADILINDPEKFVSPLHAEVHIEDESEIWIYDKSLNGTFVYHNEKYRKIEKWCLMNGDIIVLCYSKQKGPHKILKFRS